MARWIVYDDSLQLWRWRWGWLTNWLDDIDLCLDRCHFLNKLFVKLFFRWLLISFYLRFSDIAFGLVLGFKFHDNLLQPGQFSHHLELIIFLLLFLNLFKSQFWILKFLNDFINEPGPGHFIILILCGLYFSRQLLVLDHLSRSWVRASWIVLVGKGIKRVNIFWTVPVIDVVSDVFSLVNVLPVHQ